MRKIRQTDPRNAGKGIPVKRLAEEYHTGIAVRKIESDDFRSLDDAAHSHRHDYHFFFLQVKGTVLLEIDFERYKTTGITAFYIHPNQVHRIVSVEGMTAYLLTVKNEHINPDYLSLLSDISPSKPLQLTKRKSGLVVDAFRLCIPIFARTYDRVYTALLKDGCNTLIALIISLYLEQSKPVDQLSRFDRITKMFALALEQNFTTLKSPADFAGLLNISTPYLNECVKTVTGLTVSHHIQQRIILEAKRLLYHSGKSVKEIATELGYDDHAYFSRLFTKIAGVTATAFRTGNLD